MASFQTKKIRGGIVTLLITLCFYSLQDTTTATTATTASWINHGGSLDNRRNADREIIISPMTVSRLKLKWKFFAGKDISATPAVADGVVYFPSWNGYLYAVNAFNGNLIWKQNISEITGLSATGTGVLANVNATVSRSTPTIAGELLIVGIYGPGVVFAVKRSNGGLVWLTQIDPNPRVQITASGSSYLGAFYVGVSSLEVGLPAAQCCTFRGSLVKLNVRTGEIIWQTFTLPDNGGRRGNYSGAAIWGSSPAIDVPRKLVYVGTGQLYTVPPEVEACQKAQNNNQSIPTQPDQCFGSDIHFNSILAFDMNTGRIKWARQLGGYDVFYFVCLVPNNPDCPTGPNLDADFGEAPMLITIKVNGTRRDVAVAVQKSGFAWALDRDNGDIVWFKKAGPGGLEGGGTWGAATEGQRVYTNIVNSYRTNFTLAPSNQTTTAGAWVAMESNTGKILWSTANPSNETSNGPVTLANGVLFAGSVAPNGPLYAMDASSGRILWSYNTGATIYGGASVSNGCVFIGNGQAVNLGSVHPTWTPGTSLFAFCIEY